MHVIKLIKRYWYFELIIKLSSLLYVQIGYELYSIIKIIEVVNETLEAI